MARITVEDCIERVPNRFELVLLATKRARYLTRTPKFEEEVKVPVENDKPTVIALREIAAGKIDASAVSDMVEEPAEDEGVEAVAAHMPPLTPPGGE